MKLKMICLALAFSQVAMAKVYLNVDKEKNAYAPQDSTNIAAWSVCGMEVVKTTEGAKNCVYADNLKQFNTRRTYKVRYDYYAQTYKFGDQCRAGNSYSHIKETPLTVCPSFCDNKRSLENQLSIDNNIRTQTKDCPKGGNITTTFQKVLTYAGQEYSDKGEYFYTAENCAKWSIGEKEISKVNNCHYSKKDGVYEWSSNEIDENERLHSFFVEYNNAGQAFNFKIQSYLDDQKRGKLYGFYYPKTFGDPSKIKNVIVEVVSQGKRTGPNGLTFKDRFESGNADNEQTIVAPNGQVIGKTSSIPSVKDFIFEPSLTDKCGVMTVNIESEDPMTGEAIKPLKCSTGASYNFSDFDWSKPAYYDITSYVKQGLIPYVFYVQQGNNNPFSMRVKFKVSYYD